jgi:drug/metabolite transporter (DMT)-like permease
MGFFMSGYSYAIIAVIVGSVGQIILKVGTTSYSGSIANDFFSSFSSFLNILFIPQIFIGLLCYAVSALLWIVVLSHLEVSKAYPILGLSYIFVLLLSFLFLGESLTLTKTLGSFLIVFGVVLISLKVS